ncbi:hypothetical protein DER46DRAFT_577369 [Fusarium sp. MPI-SDFR-AT-0072]|uniref:Cofilin n=1 Tax=Fusarium oxysporum f. sp. rapae TaxID=485398 RepID=A0A8J5U0R9_FUSOX|nr:Cofilin [Fusarium oxysporum f. sp. rapae]KAH7159215.1 hypothetical protein DER46DRAFT_577369 [Fusarium sp. MPI-SDFR-AT-0072]KAI7763029.1 hypothetical protein LZL87_011172 [Fusarium oxysporum]
MSNVSVSPDCISVFNDLKLRKKYDFVIYKLNDSHEEIVVDQTDTSRVDRDEKWERLLAALQDTRPSYVVYNFEYDRKENIIFIFWLPENAGIKGKMRYSVPVDKLKQSLSGIDYEMKGGDFDDVSFAEALYTIGVRT